MSKNVGGARKNVVDDLFFFKISNFWASKIVSDFFFFQSEQKGGGARKYVFV